MKTIFIEQVTNGWIVRPFSAVPEWARGCGGSNESHSVAVFSNMHELQAKLPQFFEMPDPLVSKAPARQEAGL